MKKLKSLKDNEQFIHLTNKAVRQRRPFTLLIKAVKHSQGIGL
jgi:hypothetical protein